MLEERDRLGDLGQENNDNILSSLVKNLAKQLNDFTDEDIRLRRRELNSLFNLLRQAW